MTDLRQRWDVLDGGSGDEEDRDQLRNRRIAGYVRGGLVAVIVLGLWIVLSVRQQAQEETPEPTGRPRAVVDAPAGYTPTGLIEPDLSPVEGATGTWLLLAGPDARLFGDAWVVAACRDPGSREVGNGSDIVTATLGADLSVDTTDDAGVRIAASSRGDVTSAMVLDRRPKHIVTVIASGWDGEAAALARALFDTAEQDGCTGVAPTAADVSGLPVRQERQLGAPVLPIGLRLLSADETTVAWGGAAPAASIVLTSQRLGVGGDDADLLAFLRPIGGAEAAVKVDGVPGYRADNADGSEQLVWVEDGLLHTLSLGSATDEDVVALASTLRTPTVEEWAALASAVTR